jgi:septal ring factor EnvC (AmiA/AmiB activator)
MAEARPHLTAVTEPSAPPRAKQTRGSRRLQWLLAALALLCAVGWGLARRDSAALERDLASAQSALAAATTTLQAAEAQRAEVRSQLQTLSADASALSQHLSEVEALLAADPAPAADAQPVRSEAEPRD